MSRAESKVRQIGLVSATALVVANMIGTGVFTTTGFLFADLPSRSAVLLCWLVGGCIAMLGAICYSALARSLPESGGEYFFLSRTVHPAAGYVGGWISLFVGFSAPIAAAAFALGEYTKTWFPSVTPKWIGTIALLIFTSAHAFNVRGGLRLQNGIVALKILLIFIFIGTAVVKLDAPAPPPSSPITFGAFSVSLVWIYFAYSGWNAAVYIGGEVANPERNLPRAMIFGTGLVIVLYLSLNAVFVFAAPHSELAGHVDVARIAAVAIGGNGFAEFTTALIAVALLTSISAMTMAGPRVYAKMAEDGFLPSWFRSARAPATNAVLLQFMVVLLMLWIPDFPDLAKYIGFTLGIGTALTVVGMMRMRWREPERITVPGWPWLPVLFLLAVSGVTVFSVAREPGPSLFGLLTIAIGVLMWRLQTWNRPARSRKAV